MHRNHVTYAACAALAIVGAGCASAPSPLDRVAAAYATISNAAGEKKGTIELWQDMDKIVHVAVQVTGMPPGPHGIHFHATGQCDGSTDSTMHRGRTREMRRISLSMRMERDG
jgi:Cu-Zn family superoxide dismutase